MHSLLGFLVDRLALRFLCQSEKEVDKYQCLDKDVPLKSEIAQLEMISHSASTNLSLIAYLKLEQIAACEIFGVVGVGKSVIIISVLIHLPLCSLRVPSLYHLRHFFELGESGLQALLKLFEVILLEQSGRVRERML